MTPEDVDQAAAALCRQYIAEMLQLPARLPGIQYHEITEEGREVYRRLVRVVVSELSLGTTE